MKSSKLSSTEKLLNNVDLLQNIFSFLTIGDQLRFANISEQLKFIFVNYISKRLKFKNSIKIEKLSEQINLKSENKVLANDLSLEEFEYFLNIFGNNVKILQEYYGTALSLQVQLKNLHTIHYQYLLITKKHLQLLADTCPFLQVLIIEGCCNEKRKILRFGKDIKVSDLLTLKNLKTFELKTGLDYKIKCGLYKDLAKETNSLLNQNSNIEKINIYIPILSEHFFKNFLFLKHLTISVYSNVTNGDLINLATCCQYLEYLDFIRTCFHNIEQFSILRNLKYLYFHNCEGLTYDHLRDILTKTKLLIFKSYNTKYCGIFHYYFISSSLKHIYIDAIKSFDFKSEIQFYRKCIKT